jgi:outer membrane protein OmpA-like peptidoglycan-associated protein
MTMNGLRFTAVVLSVAVASGCATKKFVRGNVGEINEKVESLSKSLEETQQQAQTNTQQIESVANKTESVQQSAAQASQAASQAAALAQEAGARAKAIDEANRRLVAEVVLSEDQGSFRFNSAELPDAAKQRIDALVSQLKDQDKSVFITIAGYTDNVGPRAVNEEVGLERARAVRRYLYEQHHIPLHRMDVISYGEADPVAPNNTRAGRAQNRRVEIMVIA